VTEPRSGDPPAAPLAAPGGPPRLVYDGRFVGPMLPPGTATSSHPGPSDAPRSGPVSDAVLGLPLGTRQLVGAALDLLTRPDSGLRSASFYVGLLVLLTAAPIVILLGLAATVGVPLFEPFAPSSLDQPIVVATFLALGGYVVAGVESRVLATAVIGGRAEARPLRLRESIAVARRRFWTTLGASVVVGFITVVVSAVIQLPIGLALGNVEAINYGLSLVVGTLVGAPFVYVAAGIVLGEVGAFEAIKRSIRLARARKRLALVVALFGILSQFIVLFGISIGADVVVRIVGGTGVAEAFPPALVIPLAAALVFAFGTLLFLVDAISAAPAVYAFEALTHYTHGLQVGRDRPAGGRTIFSPWLTPGLAVAAGVGLLLVVAGIVGLPV
jgi:hypothetical protein